MMARKVMVDFLEHPVCPVWMAVKERRDIKVHLVRKVFLDHAVLKVKLVRPDSLVFRDLKANPDLMDLPDVLETKEIAEYLDFQVWPETMVTRASKVGTLQQVATGTIFSNFHGDR